MTRPSDVDRLLASWFLDGPVSGPPEVLSSAFARARSTRQRRPWLVLLRGDEMRPTGVTVQRLRGNVRLGPIALVAAILVLALAALALMTGSQRRLPPPFGLAANGLVAFTSQGRLFVQNADGSSQRQITDELYTSYPTWSGDGSKIAFFRYFRSPSQVPPYSIWDVNADGSGLTNLTGNMAVQSFDDPALVSWAPDGRSLVFASGVPGKGYRLFSVRADGSGLRDFLGPALAPMDPVWSPDGATIAFKGGRLDDNIRGIYLVRADGSGDARRVTHASGLEDKYSFMVPQWSPDGTKLLFYAGDTTHDIWVVSADGSGERNLTRTPDPADEFWPVWSPDGSRIAYEVSRDGLATVDVVVMNADGTHAHVLARQGLKILAAQVAWAPDGTRVLAAACLNECPSQDFADVLMGFDPSGSAPPQRMTSIVGGGTVISWQRVAP